jgi:hypothetical protein
MLQENISKIRKLFDSDTAHMALRENSFWAYKRFDNSLFAYVSGLFVLQSTAVYLLDREKGIIKEIEEIIFEKYAAYKNKDGKVTYNFYPTVPSQHFGNGFFMQHFDHFRLPDDIDDTALVYLTQGVFETDLVHELEKHLHESGVFNTWFGKKMPKEIDVCASLNMLLLLYRYQKTDLQIVQKTEEYLIMVIPMILKEPFRLARHYGNAALILYHYARFISLSEGSRLHFLKPVLINYCLAALQNEKNAGRQLLLEIALLKFGEKRPEKAFKVPFENFHSFIGAPFAPLFGTSPIFNSKYTLIFWKSDFHELALLLEYEALLSFNKNSR